VEADSIEVAQQGNELTVAGQRRLPPIARQAAILRLEIPHGRFERRIRLPSAQIALDQSELAQGCLMIRLAKLA
jgi:HSP20 family molecular chaperone IbpA